MRFFALELHLRHPSAALSTWVKKTEATVRGIRANHIATQALVAPISTHFCSQYRVFPRTWKLRLRISTRLQITVSNVVMAKYELFLNENFVLAIRYILSFMYNRTQSGCLQDDIVAKSKQEYTRGPTSRGHWQSIVNAYCAVIWYLVCVARWYHNCLTQIRYPKLTDIWYTWSLCFIVRFPLLGRPYGMNISKNSALFY